MGVAMRRQLKQAIAFQRAMSKKVRHFFQLPLLVTPTLVTPLTIYAVLRGCFLVYVNVYPLTGIIGPPGPNGPPITSWLRLFLTRPHQYIGARSLNIATRTQPQRKTKRKQPLFLTIVCRVFFSSV